jgi:hypothetical protein
MLALIRRWLAERRRVREIHRAGRAYRKANEQ